MSTSDQEPPISRSSRLSGLLNMIRRNAGRITPRQVVRHGFGCKSTQDAKQLLRAFVGDRLAKWYRGRSAHRGGRRGIIFVLNLDAKEPPCYDHVSSDFEAAVRLTIMGADELRTLAWDLGQLLLEHHRANPSVSVKSVARLLSHFRQNIE